MMVRDERGTIESNVGERERFFYGWLVFSKIHSFYNSHVWRRRYVTWKWKWMNTKIQREDVANIRMARKNNNKKSFSFVHIYIFSLAFDFSVFVCNLLSVSWVLMMNILCHCWKSTFSQQQWEKWKRRKFYDRARRTETLKAKSIIRRKEIVVRTDMKTPIPQHPKSFS